MPERRGLSFLPAVWRWWHTLVAVVATIMLGFLLWLFLSGVYATTGGRG